MMVRIPNFRQHNYSAEIFTHLSRPPHVQLFMVSHQNTLMFEVLTVSLLAHWYMNQLI